MNDLATKHKCGKTIDCFNSNKNLLASAFIVEDAQTVYYLFGGYNDTFKNSGAMTFLLHHIIQQSLAQQKDFNFCGSTKKSIALFFEAFGASKIDIPIWQKSMI
ncbi:MAG: GNAT family N-acetyltransferase [Saprospirales bacterium]|nr:GNAT family N-acetyltransferase [Saprospirales bacterium]